MGVIKGQNLRLKVGGKYVAFATSCTVHLAANLEETSTKDSTNDFQEQAVTGVSWDASVDALYTVAAEGTTGTGFCGEELLNMLIDPTKREVDVEFRGTLPGSEKNRGADSGTVYSGTAIISDISITAANRQNSTYTVQLQGNGPLTGTTSTVSGT